MINLFFFGGLILGNDHFRLEMITFALHRDREIHPLDPQPHRHSMLVTRVCAPRVTRCSLGKYWSRDFFQKEAESSRQGVGNPEPYLFSLPLSRSDRLPRRWGQQAARLGYTGYL